MKTEKPFEAPDAGLETGVGSATLAPAGDPPANEPEPVPGSRDRQVSVPIDRRALLRRPLTMALAAVGGGALLAGCDFTAAPFNRHVHLLKRLTFGATPAARDHINTIGESAWLAEQWDPASMDTSAIDAKTAALPALGQTAAELFKNYPNDADARAASIQLQLASGIRAAESPAQLFERMVDFWSDHFNVPFHDDAILERLKLVEDRNIIRPRALTSFSELVVASALSPAMLYYLDNFRSTAGAINENYGRELLELHTVGVDGGYTEADVVATSRLLTGWGIDRDTGLFKFSPGDHDTSPLTIMGWTRPTTGDPFSHGVEFLQWLATQETCARFVSRKLAVRFVADNPDPALVDAMTNTWLANNSAVAPVLQTMIDHPAFDAAVSKKFRRPLDYFAFVLRALGAQTVATTDITQLGLLGGSLDGLGQLPFSWPAPNGYPDVENPWLNTGAMLGRWNLAGDIVGDAFAPISYDIAPIRTSLSGRTALEIYNLVANTLVLEDVTGVGRGFLNSQTGWTDGLHPSAAQIDAQLEIILVSVLAAADAQYR